MKSNRPDRHSGFSLVELLVSVTVGLILLAGVAQVFVNSKQGYRVQESNSRLQESSRFALDYFNRAIRVADYWGGAKSSTVTVTGLLGAARSTCTDAWITNPTDGVHGYAGASAASGIADGSGASDPPASCLAVASCTGYVPQSDVLALRYADPDTYFATTSPPSGSQYIVRSKAGVNAEVSGNFTTATGDIPGTDGSGGIFNYQLQTMVFYLQTCKVGANTLPTLYALSLQGATFQPQPLVDGIEMLKFEYGVDPADSGSVSQYQTADKVSDWSKVLSIRVSIIVRGDSLDTFFDTQNYQMTSNFCYGPGAGCGASYAGFEKYSRRLVIKEIQIRNRVRE